MKRTAKIRNIVLGEGRPKICVPVTGVSYEDIVSQMEKIYRDYRQIADIIELRIDFFEEVFDNERLSGLLKSVRQAIGDMALLLTFRTKREGGEKEISPEKYMELIKLSIDSGMIDGADVEAFFDDNILKDVSDYSKGKNVIIIGSNHDFEKTPEKSEIVRRLKIMEERGADIAKIAVMPKSKMDVAELITALCDADEMLDIPVAAISMGKLGAVSRIAGEVFGSCLTFGVADKASAPGQPEAEKLMAALELLSLKDNKEMDVKEKKYKNEKNIMLIGFMGAGKTTVSRELTRLTGKSEVDMDAYIVQNEGRSINEIFEKQGEAYFRQLETKYLGEIQKNSGYIVSCGGGAVLKDENVRLMKENGVIILLTATPETTLLRVQNSKDRPILNGNMNIEFITQLMDKRKDRYLEVADIIVETDNKAVRAIADEILEKYSLFCKK